MKIFWVYHRQSGFTDCLEVEAHSEAMAEELARLAGFEPDLIIRPPERLAGLKIDDDETPVDWETCEMCWGRGYAVTCLDDICQGGDHCIHGDGEHLCPGCGGIGEVPIYFSEDD